VCGLKQFNRQREGTKCEKEEVKSTDHGYGKVKEKKDIANYASHS
jgi:hypothetical protein